jgi:steroid delta-isomerase-like uncharacterized protein
MPVDARAAGAGERRPGRWCIIRGTGVDMTVEDNKRLARRLLETVYERGQLDAADELIAPEFVDHEPAHPGLPVGPEAARQTARQLLDAFGDLRFDIELEIAEDDKVVQLVTMRGRHTGAVAGRPPTGRAFAVRHVYVWRIEHGRIVEHWGSRDDLGLLQQLRIPVSGERQA